MFGTTGDAVLSCLVAAVLVIVAHGLDTLAARRRGSWANSLALALCALAMVVLVLEAVDARDRTSLLLLCSTLVAVGVSSLPLFGVGVQRPTPDQAPVPPAGPARPAQTRNPWDQTFKVRRNRAAELLGLTVPRPRAAPTTPAPATAEGPGRAEQRPEPGRTPVQGEVVAHGPEARTRPSPSSSPRAFPEVDQAEETLDDVGAMIGDLGRLLGLDRRDPR